MHTETAIIAVDVQNDFCPNGKLPVTDGHLVVAPLNKMFQAARKLDIPVFATRDWHPEKAQHFADYGGIWPEHCVINTPGGQFHPDLRIDGSTIIISKGIDGQDAYSGFEGSVTAGSNPEELNKSLDEVLKARGVNRLMLGGLATDYCVKATALAAIESGYETYLIQEAVRAVNINPNDGIKAISEMIDKGVKVISLERALELIGQS